MSEERIHVCVLAEKFPARSETFILEHVVGLARRGHEVSVISAGPEDGISSAELAAMASTGVNLLHHGEIRGSHFSKACQLTGVLMRHPVLFRKLRRSRPWYDPECVIACLKLECMKRGHPDVVHIHFGNHARALHDIGCRLPAVVTWHGYDANLLPRQSGEDMYRSLFEGRWHHTVGSTFMKKRLIELGAQPEQISIVPMGIDLERFSYEPRTRENSEPLRLISVGRLDEMKGHRYLIQAVAKLVDEGLLLDLRIIGEGPLRAELESQIAGIGGRADIVLVGALSSDAIASEMQRAHVFALSGVVAASGRVETQGVVFAEAQASGLPVIGSSVGGVSESLIDGETGLLCPPGDISAIKSAIRYFYENPSKMEAFGRRGRSFIERNFSRIQMLDRFESLYRSILT